MDEITRCTRELLEALKKSEAYQAFRDASRKLEDKPELKAQIDDFRRHNYLLQNSSDSEDIFEKMASFEKKYENLRKNPLVNEYLRTELQICRIVQRCAMEIMTSVDLEIENFADVIEI